jgi:hypothetical protein
MQKIDLGAALAGHLQEASSNNESDPNIDVVFGPVRQAQSGAAEAPSKTELEQSPNYRRIVEAYRGFTEQTMGVDQCVARLLEVTKILAPGLKLFHLPVVQNKLLDMTEEEQTLAVATFERTEELHDAVEGMIAAMRSGDHAALQTDYETAVACFQELDAVQDEAIEAAVETRKRKAEDEAAL